MSAAVLVPMYGFVRKNSGTRKLTLCVNLNAHAAEADKLPLREIE